MPLMTFFRARHYCLCFNVGQRIKTSFVFFCFFLLFALTQKPREREEERFAPFMKIYRLLRGATLMPSFFAQHSQPFIVSPLCGGEEGTKNPREKKKSLCGVNNLRLFGFLVLHRPKTREEKIAPKLETSWEIAKNVI